MIANMTYPSFTRYEWHLHNGMVTFSCHNDSGSCLEELRLSFDSVAEAEAFATTAGQMAQDFRASKVPTCQACGAPGEAICVLCRAEADVGNPAPKSRLAEMIQANGARDLTEAEHAEIATLQAKDEAEIAASGAYRVGHSAGIPF